MDALFNLRKIKESTFTKSEKLREIYFMKAQSKSNPILKIPDPRSRILVLLQKFSLLIIVKSNL